METQLVWVCRSCASRRKHMTNKREMKNAVDGPCDLCSKSEFDLRPLQMKTVYIERAQKKNGILQD